MSHKCGWCGHLFLADLTYQGAKLCQTCRDGSVGAPAMTTPPNPTRKAKRPPERDWFDSCEKPERSPKPVQCWIVYDDRGCPRLSSIRGRRDWAIYGFITSLSNGRTWPVWCRLGYRCRKVTLPRIAP